MASGRVANLNDSAKLNTFCEYFIPANHLGACREKFDRSINPNHRILNNLINRGASKLIIALIALSAALIANAAELKSLRLPSGERVTVLSIEKTRLHQSNEIALVLTYQTSKDFVDIMSVAYEVEQVWLVFKKDVEKARVGAAVVVASEAPRLNGLTRSAGWVWKRGADGSWHPPRENDRALVPKR